MASTPYNWGVDAVFLPDFEDVSFHDVYVILKA